MRKFAAFFFVFAFLAAPAIVFAQQAGEETKEAGQAAGQAAEETGEAAQQGAQEAGQAAQQGAQQAGEAVQQGAQEAQQGVQQATQQDQQVAQEMLRRFDDLTGTEITNQAQDIQGSIRDVVLTTQGELTHIIARVSAAQPAAGGEGQPAAGGEAPAQPGTQPGAAQPQDQNQAGAAEANAGSNDYLIPVDQVTFGQPNQAAVVNMDLQQIEQQPSLQDGKLPANLGGQGGGQAPTYVLGSELKDYKFVGQNGDDIGGVNDIMLDLQNKKIAYLALGTGGFLGLGQKLVAVSVDAVTDWNLQDKKLQTSLTGDQLDSIEGFDGKNWPAQPQVQGAGAQGQQQQQPPPQQQPQDQQQPAPQDQQPPQDQQQQPAPQEQPQQQPKQ